MFLFWLDRHGHHKAGQRLPRSYPDKVNVDKKRIVQGLKVMFANLAQISQAPERHRLPIKKPFFKDSRLPAHRASFITERRIFRVMTSYNINQKRRSSQKTNWTRFHLIGSVFEQFPSSSLDAFLRNFQVGKQLLFSRLCPAWLTLDFFQLHVGL